MEVATTWFESWFNSPYYHKLYFQRDEKEAATFIDSLINHLQPPAGSLMLDVACGRGRHALQLNSKGYTVTGIDLSAGSIAIAKELENQRLEFFQHDMRLPFRVNYYDYAFNFFTSFGYFRTEREHYSAVRTLAGALKEGGTLVMDYLNVHYTEDHMVHKSELEIDDVVFYITKWHDESHFYKRIIIEDESLDEPLEYIEKVAKFVLGDFNDMFAFHNLQIQDVFGDYHFNKYDVRKSPRLIMVASKILKGNGRQLDH